MNKDQIWENIRYHYCMKNKLDIDTEVGMDILSVEIGSTHDVIKNYARSRSLPFMEIISYCLIENISIESIFYTDKLEFKNSGFKIEDMNNTWEIWENIKKVYRSKYLLECNIYITMEDVAKELKGNPITLQNYVGQNRKAFKLTMDYCVKEDLDIEMMFFSYKKTLCECGKDKGWNNYKRSIKNNVAYIKDKCKVCLTAEQKIIDANKKTRHKNKKGITNIYCDKCETLLTNENININRSNGNNGKVYKTVSRICKECLAKDRREQRSKLKECDNCKKPKKISSFQRVGSTTCMACENKSIKEANKIARDAKKLAELEESEKIKLEQKKIRLAERKNREYENRKNGVVKNKKIEKVKRVKEKLKSFVPKESILVDVAPVIVKLSKAKQSLLDIQKEQEVRSAGRKVMSETDIWIEEFNRTKNY